MKTYHKHHKIPKHSNGSNDPENIVLLSIEEHAEAHRILYENHENKYDWVAWKALSGCIGKDDLLRELSRLGGIKGGETNRLSGHMSRVGSSISKEKRQEIISKAIKKQRETRSGSYFNPELRRVSCQNGGRSQGRINAESGHCKRISSIYWEKVRSGDVKAPRNIYITDGSRTSCVGPDEAIPIGWRLGKASSNAKDTIWINDGNKNKKLPKCLEIPAGWARGRKKNFHVE